MEVTYALSREDYWQFNLFVLKRRRGYFWGPVITGLLTGTLLLLLILSDEEETFSWGLSLFPLIVACATTGFSFVGRKYLVRRAVKRLPAQDGTILATRTVLVDEHGIQSRGAAGEVKYNWGGIREIVDHLDYFYFFVDSPMAFIVPKGAFPDGDTAKAFIDAARLHWQTARSTKT